MSDESFTLRHEVREKIERDRCSVIFLERKRQLLLQAAERPSDCPEISEVFVTCSLDLLTNPSSPQADSLRPSTCATPADSPEARRSRPRRGKQTRCQSSPAVMVSIDQERALCSEE